MAFSAFLRLFLLFSLAFTTQSLACLCGLLYFITLYFFYQGAANKITKTIQVHKYNLVITELSCTIELHTNSSLTCSVVVVVVVIDSKSARLLKVMLCPDKPLRFSVIFSSASSHGSSKDILHYCRD